MDDFVHDGNTDTEDDFSMTAGSRLLGKRKAIDYPYVGVCLVQFSQFCMCMANRN